MKKSKSKRSVGDPRESRYVFWTKGGQLGAHVSNVTIFGPKEVIWGPTVFGWFPWFFKVV